MEQLFDEIDGDARETSVYESLSALCGAPARQRKSQRDEQQMGLLDDEPGQPPLLGEWT